MSDKTSDDEVFTPPDPVEVKAEWTGQEFERFEFQVNQDDMIAWAESVGETDPRFLEVDHDDFRAHPTFVSRYSSSRVMPKGFPRFSRRPGIDGGKTITIGAPLRGGETITGSAEIADVYEKTGRSGSMYLVINRVTFTNESDEHVATVDTTLISPAEKKK